MQYKVGSFTTTSGLACNVECGFKPDCVIMFNDGTGASNADTVVWFSTMTDAYAFVRAAAGTQTYATSGGITPYSTNFRGFTYTAGAADIIHYIAFGSGDYEEHGDLD